METLLYLALGVVAVLALLYLGLSLLVSFCKWHDLRVRNRQRRALGLPPLSGAHRW